MAKYGSDQLAFLLIDGLSIRGTRTALTIDVERQLRPVTAFGDAWEAAGQNGLSKGALTQEGYYDDAAGSSNEALVALSGSDRVLCVGFAGNAKSRLFTGMGGALQSKYSRVVAIGEFHRANAEYLVDGKVEEGVILHEHAAETAASGNTESASHNNAAGATTAGGSAYLQVSALTLGGYTGVTIKIRHSTDNIVFADKATFAVVTVVGAERLAIAGTINKYTACNWAFGGAGAGPSITFLVGIHRD